MATKADLKKIVDELGRQFDQLNAIVSEHPSVMIVDDGWGESFSSVVTIFEPKFQNFRKKLRKVEDKLPKRKKSSGV